MVLCIKIDIRVNEQINDIGVQSKVAIEEETERYTIE